VTRRNDEHAGAFYFALTCTPLATQRGRARARVMSSATHTTPTASPAPVPRREARREASVDTSAQDGGELAAVRTAGSTLCCCRTCASGETWRRLARETRAAQQRHAYLCYGRRHKRRRHAVAVVAGQTTPSVVQRCVAIGTAQRKRQCPSLRAAEARSPVRRSAFHNHPGGISAAWRAGDREQRTRCPTTTPRQRTQRERDGELASNA